MPKDQPCSSNQLPFIASSIAVSLSKGLTNDEISELSVLLTLIGDLLGAILVNNQLVEERCKSAQGGTAPSETSGLTEAEETAEIAGGGSTIISSLSST